jgi:hypothetical protein
VHALLQDNWFAVAFTDFLNFSDFGDFIRCSISTLQLSALLTLG